MQSLISQTSNRFVHNRVHSSQIAYDGSACWNPMLALASFYQKRQELEQKRDRSSERSS
jgi:hypothetical protein